LLILGIGSAYLGGVLVVGGALVVALGAYSIHKIKTKMPPELQAFFQNPDKRPYRPAALDRRLADLLEHIR